MGIEPPSQVAALESMGREAFLALCRESLDRVPEEAILRQRSLYPSQKCLLLARKRGVAPALRQKGDDLEILCAGHAVGTIGQCAAKLEFLRPDGTGLVLEGYAGFVGMGDWPSARVFLRDQDGALLPCEPVAADPGRVEGARCLGELAFPALTFRCRLDGLGARKCWAFRVCTEQRGVLVERKALLLGCRFPVGSLRGAYAKVGGWMAVKAGNRLLLEQATPWGHILRESRFLLGIAKGGAPGRWEAIALRMLFHAARLLLRREIWLVSDRINKADDNGEAFFRWLCETGKPERAYFVLRRDSRDWERVSRYGRMLAYGSFRHRLMHLLGSKIISSAADDHVMNPFGDRIGFYWDILLQKPQVFLQHGITKDDISGWLGRYKKDLALFVTAAVPEYRSILAGKYGYDERVVKLTGLPRYDYLEDRQAGQGTRGGEEAGEGKDAAHL